MTLSPTLAHYAAAALVRGTILESELVDRYVPVQFADEYRRSAAELPALLQSSPGTIELVVLVRPSEQACPLVSVLVWAAATAMIRRLHELSISAARALVVWTREDSPEPVDPKCGRRVLDVWSALGYQPRDVDVDDLPVDGGRTNPVAARAVQLAIERPQLARLGTLTRDLLVACTYCAESPSRFIVCGQERAGLTQWLTQLLEVPRSVGLFLPWVPWPATPMFGLAHSDDQLKAVAERALRSFTTSTEQCRFIAEIRTAVNRVRGHSSTATFDDVPSSLATLTDQLVRPVSAWFRELRTALEDGPASAVNKQAELR